MRRLAIAPASGPPEASRVVAERIVTDRLVLAPLVVGDAEEMVDVLGDDALYEFIGGTALGLRELRDRYFELVAGPGIPGVSWLNWIARLEATGRAIGTVQATITPGTDAEQVAEVSWVIGTVCQKQGFASEAARSLVDWLQAQGIGAIRAYIHSCHLASATVARRAGLHQTNELRDGEHLWRTC